MEEIEAEAETIKGPAPAEAERSIDPKNAGGVLRLILDALATIAMMSADRAMIKLLREEKGGMSGIADEGNSVVACQTQVSQISQSIKSKPTLWLQTSKMYFNGKSLS